MKNTTNRNAGVSPTARGLGAPARLACSSASVGLLCLALLGCGRSSSGEPATSGATNWLRCTDVTDCSGHPAATCSEDGYCLDAAGQRISTDPESTDDSESSDATTDDDSTSSDETTDGTSDQAEDDTDTEDETDTEDDTVGDEECRSEPELRPSCEALELDLPRALVCGPDTAPPPVCVPAQPSPAIEAPLQLWCCPSTTNDDSGEGPLDAGIDDDAPLTEADAGEDPAPTPCHELSLEACEQQANCGLVTGRHVSEASECGEADVPVACADVSTLCAAIFSTGIDADGNCFRFPMDCPLPGFRRPEPGECNPCESGGQCDAVDQCQLIDDCCRCEVLGSEESYAPCPPIACERTLCAEWGIGLEDVRCTGSRCGFDPAALLRCLSGALPEQCAETPQCAATTVPEADASGCWSGRCVPANLCAD